MYRALDFALGQPLHVVWWQLGTSTGAERTLAQVRTWLRQRDQAAGEVGGHDGDGDPVGLESTSE